MQDIYPEKMLCFLEVLPLLSPVSISLCPFTVVSVDSVLPGSPFPVFLGIFAASVVISAVTLSPTLPRSFLAVP